MNDYGFGLQRPYAGGGGMMGSLQPPPPPDQGGFGPMGPEGGPGGAGYNNSSYGTQDSTYAMGEGGGMDVMGSIDKINQGIGGSLRPDLRMV